MIQTLKGPHHLPHNMLDVGRVAELGPFGAFFLHVSSCGQSIRTVPWRSRGLAGPPHGEDMSHHQMTVYTEPRKRLLYPDSAALPGLSAKKETASAAPAGAQGLVVWGRAAWTHASVGLTGVQTGTQSLQTPGCGGELMPEMGREGDFPLIFFVPSELYNL